VILGQTMPAPRRKRNAASMTPQTRKSPGRGKSTRHRHAARRRCLTLLYGQQRRAPSIGRLRCRAMVTAALPLGISLTLDQVHAIVVLRVVDRPR
jgi:hypothetical protein